MDNIEAELQTSCGTDVPELTQLLAAIVEVHKAHLPELAAECKALAVNRAAAGAGAGTSASAVVGTERVKQILESFNVGQICLFYTKVHCVVTESILPHKDEEEFEPNRSNGKSLGKLACPSDPHSGWQPWRTPRLCCSLAHRPASTCSKSMSSGRTLCDAA